MYARQITSEEIHTLKEIKRIIETEENKKKEKWYFVRQNKNYWAYL